MEKRYCDGLVGYNVHGRAVVEYGMVVHRCSRLATHVVTADDVATEYLCTQHANKVINSPVADDVSVRRIK